MRLSTIVAIIVKNISIWILKLSIWILKLFKGEKIVYPYKLLINVTNKCNSRCKYCRIWTITKNNSGCDVDEIDVHTLTKLFRQMNKHLLWLALSGGEITLFDHYTDLVLAAKKYCPKLKIITFTTNGLLPEKALEYALFTKKQGFDVFVTVSLDGNKEVHDRLRGVHGNYESAWETYTVLKENRINCYFGLTVSDQNCTFIQHQYKDYNKVIKAITFVHSKGIYRKSNNMKYNVIFNALLHIIRNFNVSHLSEIIEKIHIKLSLHFLKQRVWKNIIPCEVIQTSLHIMADGTVKPCMYLPALGNIKRDTLPDLLKHPNTEELKNTVKQGNCSHCWLNCYSPHSIMQHPFKSFYYFLKRV